MPQPTVVVADINCDTIEDLHLEALYAFFCHSVTADEAGEILNGKRVPIEDDEESKDKHAHEESQAKTVLQAKLEAVKDRAMSAVGRARAAQNRLRHAMKQKCLPQSVSQSGSPVAAMAILPIVLPIVMRIYISLYGSLEMRMLVKDSKWET